LCIIHYHLSIVDYHTYIMGIIKRQSLKNSIVSYLGVLIGAVSVIFIYPIIDPNDLGIIQFTMNVAILFAPLAGFASSLTAIQYYPHFKDEKNKDNGFLFILTSATFLISILFIILVYIYRIPISEWFNKDKQHFLDTLPYILFFTVIIALANLLHAYASLSKRIVVPAILQNLWIKIAQPILVLLFAYGIISFAGIYKGLAVALFIMLVGMVAYIGFLKQLHLKPNFSKLTPQIARQMLGYSGFNLLVSFGGLLAQRVDMILVAPLTEKFSSVAVFNFGFVISEAIDVPRKALAGIAAPVISQSMKSGNIKHVEEIYRKSALLQMIAGVFLLAGIWACADALFDLMPKNGDAYRAGKNVILLLGLSRVVDMATGTNAEIITYSQYYRFNFISLGTMAVLNVTLNFWLVPTIGIVGSALATLISITLVNAWRLVYIYQKIKIHPLDTKMFLVIAIGLVAWLAGHYTPSVFHPILTIFLKGMTVSVVYISGILLFKISDDVTALTRFLK
jgi:O-antigen/teichoic acid export membrane protein